jgi:hypothetical protein
MVLRLKGRPMRLRTRALAIAGIAAALVIAYVAVDAALRRPDYRCEQTLESLLVDPAEFTYGSTSTTPSPLPTFETSTGTPSRACESHYSGAFGHAFHVVYYYEDEDAARRAYTQLTSSVFRARAEGDLPWSESREIGSAPAHADEVTASCTERVGMGPRCTALARYGKLLSLFESEVSSSGMTRGDVARILQRVDTALMRTGVADPE